MNAKKCAQYLVSCNRPQSRACVLVSCSYGNNVIIYNFLLRIYSCTTFLVACALFICVMAGPRWNNDDYSTGCIDDDIHSLNRKNTFKTCLRSKN